MSSNFDELAGAFRRAAITLVITDVFMSVMMVVFWLFVGLTDPRLVVGVTVIRGLAWLGYLVRTLAPVRLVARARADPSDAELLAADGLLQDLPRRVMLVYGLLWLISEGLWAISLAAGVPIAIAHGDPEVIALCMFAISAIGLGVLLRLVIDGAFLDLHMLIAVGLTVRGVVRQRRPSELLLPVVRTTVVMVVGALLVLGGLSIIWNVASEREIEIERQRHLVELSASHVANAIGEPLAGVEIVTFEQLRPELRAALGSGEITVAALALPERGEAVAAASIGDGRWTTSSAEVESQLLKFGGLLILVVLAALPVFSYGLLTFTRTITLPLERFGEAAGQFVTHGELGALERITPLRDDQVARLAINFNHMLDILGELSDAAAAVSSGDLTVELEHPGELHDAFRGMLVRLNEIVGRLRETSLELASAAAEINALTQQQEQAAEIHATNVAQVNDTVASLATSAIHIADAAKDVVEDAERAAATTDATAERIGELRGHTTQIGELLELIREVADRSDLLALNGSLEATRAGEAGRGFALVAAEMRRLAERVTGTVADVRVRVTEIEASGASTVIATEDSRKLVSRAAEAARDISTITARQSMETEQASIAVQSVAEIVAQTSRAISQTRAAAEGLRAHAGELERLIASFEIRELE